jgi:hypothetical protein
MRPALKTKRSLAAAALLAALVAAAILAPGAAARRTTAVIPNGTYGVNAPGGEYIVFTVRNRHVRNLNFQMQITCQASDSPTSEQRFFTAGAEAPQNRLVPNNGKLRLNWQERGDGRLGQVSVELKFGIRDIANFSVIVPEERTPETGPEDALESCNGVSALHFHRGFELAPVPLP